MSMYRPPEADLKAMDPSPLYRLLTMQWLLSNEGYYNVESFRKVQKGM